MSRLTPIPSRHKFLSGSMETILKNRIDSIANQRLADVGGSNGEAYEFAYADQKIASTLLKLNTTAKNRNYIRNVTTRNNGMISFLPSGQECILNDSGQWSRQNRVDCKAGKFLNKLKNERDYAWTDQDVEQFVNYYKSKTIVRGEFSVVRGDDILTWYHENTYADVHNLNTSCMKYDSCQRYLGIYARNPEVTMLVLVNDENRLEGRALLWDGKYMDRVYGGDDTIVAFHNYADDNELTPIYHCGAGEITVEISKTKFDYYPYMDSLHNIYTKGVSNKYDVDNLGSYIGSARSTGGHLEGEDDENDDYYASCDDCGVGMYEDCYYYINEGYYCEDCIVYSEVHGSDIPKCAATRLHDGTYCYDDETIRLHDGQWAYGDDDDLIELHDGQYAMADEVVQCEYKDAWYLDRDVVIFTINNICVADVNVDDYLYEEYGFRLYDYDTSIDHVDDDEVQDLINRHIATDDGHIEPTYPAMLNYKPATDTTQQCEMFTTTGDTN